MSVIRIAGAQLNLTVGDITGNGAAIGDAMEWAEGERADVLLLPELAITGYPPEDLVLRNGFVRDNLAMLAKLAPQARTTTTVVGFVDMASEAPPRLDDSVPRAVANAAALLAGGEVGGVYHKVLLPNYGVFDEARYFVPGPLTDRIYTIAGVDVGISICEDIWVVDGPPDLQAAAGAQVLLNINGSPYHVGKEHERHALLSAAARRAGVPVVYVNMVGGQDELVFDGQSMAFDDGGELIFRADQFATARFVIDVEVPSPKVRPEAEAVAAGHRAATAASAPWVAPSLDEDAEVYRALQLGLSDYVAKNGFSSVVVGLSGGIDSSLTAAIAVDALGADAVWGVAMPGPYNAPESLEDAAVLADALGIRFDVIEIGSIFAAHRQALAGVFRSTEEGVAEENLQSRIRGALLMAISNKFGPMVVATGNKSEMAVGYATLYGDMAGGYAVLKDVFKTRVYRLARWRNAQGRAIPERVLAKPPSAELRPNQLDSDALGPYEQLDDILQPYIEGDASVSDIVALGHDEATVRRVVEMVDNNEYKRRQAAPGVKITKKAFGRDRRLPITNRGRR